MEIIAFDSKKFWRFKRKWNKEGNKEEMEPAFVSQLGIGVTITDPGKFTEHYINTSQRLKNEFDLDYSTPFYSSTCLKDHLSIFRAAAFAERLVSEVQDLIKSIHCSFVTLPILDIPHVEVGGVRCPKRRMPPVRFIESLGSAFSYLTALSYMWEHESANECEMHIDAFTSKQTLAWDILTERSPLKVSYRGDECNPFISCADMVAYLVDDRLATHGLRLNHANIRRVLEPHPFDVTVHHFDQRSLDFYTWKEDKMINMTNRLKRPVVFLSIDRLDSDGYGLERDIQDEPHTDKSSGYDVGTRQTEVYQAALRHAYQHNGCMKLFSPTEDRAIAKPGDVFIHAGSNSERMGKELRAMTGVQVYSGLEIINSKKTQ